MDVEMAAYPSSADVVGRYFMDAGHVAEHLPATIPEFRQTGGTLAVLFGLARCAVFSF
jgi:hypothetical protein